MANLWDVPAIPVEGDATADQTYLMVGRALTNWEHLESALGQLFAFLVGAQVSYPNNEPAMRAYGSVVSFQGRATMLEEAANGYFHLNRNSEFEERFHTIVKVECRQFSARRNDIAHGRLQQAWQSNGRIGHFLMPGFHSSKSWKVGDTTIPKYSYTSRELQFFSTQFEELYDKVSGFVNDMMDAHRHQSSEKS
jgi:hypothetical protein